MASDSTQCSSCGSKGDMHEHHIAPRSMGGSSLPTVFLCIPCHSAVHGVEWDVDHSNLTRLGLARAKARGKSLGGYRGGPVPDSRSGASALRAKADAFAARVQPAISEMQARGLSLTRWRPN